MHEADRRDGVLLPITSAPETRIQQQDGPDTPLSEWRDSGSVSDYWKAASKETGGCIKRDTGRVPSLRAPDEAGPPLMEIEDTVEEQVRIRFGTLDDFPKEFGDAVRNVRAVERAWKRLVGSL